MAYLWLTYDLLMAYLWLTYGSLMAYLKIEWIYKLVYGLLILFSVN